jgi:hypothetical protein
MYSPHESIRDGICASLDAALSRHPHDFPALLQLLEQSGYEVKHGKHIAVRGNFIRLDSLGEGYTEADLRAVTQGAKEHTPRIKTKQHSPLPQTKVNLLIDLQNALDTKGPGYRRWASVYNLKQMAQTMLFLREHNIESLDQLREQAASAADRFDTLTDSIKNSEKRLTEIAVLKKHIINYSKTKDTYIAYRKAGYSKKFFEAHREELTLHKAAKAAFDELGVQKLPRIAELNAEYATVLEAKKKAYAEYREAKNEMQELLRAKKNVELFFEAEQRQEEQHPQHEAARRE